MHELERRPKSFRDDALGGALVRYYCVAHNTCAIDRSPITRFNGAWSFCVNGYGGGHDWRRIEPVRYEELRSFGPKFIDRDRALVAV
jgi:hypothetical protein